MTNVTNLHLHNHLQRFTEKKVANTRKGTKLSGFRREIKSDDIFSHGERENVHLPSVAIRSITRVSQSPLCCLGLVYCEVDEVKANLLFSLSL